LGQHGGGKLYFVCAAGQTKKDVKATTQKKKQGGKKRVCDILGFWRKGVSKKSRDGATEKATGGSHAGKWQKKSEK